jgi:hypothetical protein
MYHGFHFHGVGQMYIQGLFDFVVAYNGPSSLIWRIGETLDRCGGRRNREATEHTPPEIVEEQKKKLNKNESETGSGTGFGRATTSRERRSTTRCFAFTVAGCIQFIIEFRDYGGVNILAS